MQHPDYKHLHRTAFANMGLQLPLDGAKDGDLNTLSMGNARRLTDGSICPEITDTALNQTFGKVLNPTGQNEIPCPETPRDITIDWSHLKLGKRAAVEIKPKVRAIKRALKKWNDEHIQGFKKSLEADLSDRTMPIPTTGYTLQLADVLAMTKMFNAKYGDRGEQILFNNILGLDVFNDNGGIWRAPPPPGDERWVNWEGLQIDGTGNCIPKDAAIRRVLKDVDALNETPRVPRRTLTMNDAADRVRVDRDCLALHLHHQLPQQWERMRSEVYVRTLWKPSANDQMNAEQLKRLNISRAKGIELGISWQDYEQWYNLFQIEVEERMLDTVGQRGVIVSTGLCIFNSLTRHRMFL